MERQLRLSVGRERGKEERRLVSKEVFLAAACLWLFPVSVQISCGETEESPAFYALLWMSG